MTPEQMKPGVPYLATVTPATGDPYTALAWFQASGGRCLFTAPLEGGLLEGGDDYSVSTSRLTDIRPVALVDPVTYGDRVAPDGEVSHETAEMIGVDVERQWKAARQ